MSPPLICACDRKDTAYTAQSQLCPRLAESGFCVVSVYVKLPRFSSSPHTLFDSTHPELVDVGEVTDVLDARNAVVRQVQRRQLALRNKKRGATLIKSQVIFATSILCLHFERSPPPFLTLQNGPPFLLHFDICHFLVLVMLTNSVLLVESTQAHTKRTDTCTHMSHVQVDTD